MVQEIDAAAMSLWLGISSNVSNDLLIPVSGLSTGSDTIPCVR